MIKKIILISLGVLVLIGGGLTAYVSTMDWNSHKDKIAMEISNMIGEKVEFSGSLDVSLLPHPHMYATDITIINPATSDKLATIQKMETEVTLRSILRKTPDIQSLVLDDVEMWINVDDKGKTNWHQEGEPQFINADIQSRLQNFTLKNTTLHFVYPKYDINADLVSSSTDVQTHSLAGPYTITGSFKKDNELFGVSIGIESFSRDQDTSLNFIVMHDRTKSYLRYDGKYNFETDNFQGDFSGNSERTADFVNILLNKNVLEDKYNKALLFSTAAKSTSKILEFTHLVVKFEQYIEGAGDIIIPRAGQDDKKPVVDVKYQLVNLDLRPVLAVLKAKFNDYQGNKSYEPDTKRDAVFDITAEHVAISDAPMGYVENMSAKGSWTDNVLNLDDFYAGCQGNIIWTMSGSLLEENSEPHYYAKMSFDGQNFLSLINSFDDTFTAPSQSAYRDGKVSFDIFGDTKSLKINNAEINLDKMKMSADAEIALDHKAYTIHVDTDKINFDNYIARDTEVFGIKDILIADSKKLAWLNNADISVNFNANEVSFRAIPFKNVVLDFDVNAGVLKINDAQGEDLLDSNIKLSATVRGIGTENLSVENAHYEINSHDLNSLIGKLEIPAPDWPLFKQENISSEGTITGNFEKAEVNVKNTIDDIHWDYEGDVWAENDKPTFKGKTNIKAPNFEDYLSLLGYQLADNISLKSVFTGSAEIEGNIEHLLAENADVQIGFSKYKGNLDVQRIKKKYAVKADATVNELNLENVLSIQSSKTGQRKADLFDDIFIIRPVLNRDAIDYEIYKDVELDVSLKADRVLYKNLNFNEVSVHVVNKDNRMQLQDLDFRYGEAEYKGNVFINYAQVPQIQGNMDISNLNISDLGGKIYKFDSGILHLNGDFTAPAESFENIVNGMSGKFSFDVGPFTMRGFNFIAISDDLAKREYSKGVFQMVRDNLQSGLTTFDSFIGEAEMKDGTMSFISAQMKNADVEVNLNGKISLSDWKMNTDFAVRYLKTTEIPEFSFSLTGMINKPVLDINVENIVKKYDSHWEQVEQEIQAKKDEELRVLQDKMAAAQKKTIAVSDKVSIALPVLEQYSQKTTSQATLAQYQSKVERLNKINQSVDEMQSLSRQTDFTLDDVRQIEEKCPSFISEIDDILHDARSIYLEDIKMRMQITKDAAAEINANNKKLFEDYQKMIQDDFDELMKVNASQYMVNNADLKSQQGEIANYNNRLIDMYDAFNSKLDISKTYISTDEQEVALVDLQQRLEEMRATFEQMEKVRSKSADILLNMVNERRAIYEEELAKKEAKRRKENAENANNLLASDAEKDQDEEADNVTKTSPIEHDNEAIPTSGSIIQKDQVSNEIPSLEKRTGGILKVGGQSDEKVSGTIIKSYDDTKVVRPTTGGGYLKPIEGDVQKTTGTITVK